MRKPHNFRSVNQRGKNSDAIASQDTITSDNALSLADQFLTLHAVKITVSYKDPIQGWEHAYCYFTSLRVMFFDSTPVNVAPSISDVDPSS